MKHLKQYESNKEPQIGDYVICYEEPDNNMNTGIRSSSTSDELNNFLLNNIGQIIDIEPDNSIPYEVKYENIPSKINHWFHDLKLNCRSIRKSEIIHCSKNKEKLEYIITANKYNL